MLELLRKIDFGSFMSWKTQPNSRAFDDRRPTGPCFNSCQKSRLLSGLPDLFWFFHDWHYHWDSFLWDFGFSTLFSHSAAWKRTRRRIRLCHFSTLVNIVTETTIVSTGTLPVGLPLPTNLQEFFVHAVLSLDSWPRRFSQNLHFWRQNYYFEFLARNFSSPSS